MIPVRAGHIFPFRETAGFLLTQSDRAPTDFRLAVEAFLLTGRSLV